MDLSDSVILPREDFIELQQVAWNQPPTSAKERASTMGQTTFVLTIVAATITAATWGYGWATVYREKKLQELRLREAEITGRIV